MGFNSGFKGLINWQLLVGEIPNTSSVCRWIHRRLSKTTQYCGNKMEECVPQWRGHLAVLLCCCYHHTVERSSRADCNRNMTADIRFNNNSNILFMESQVYSVAQEPLDTRYLATGRPLQATLPPRCLFTPPPPPEGLRMFITTEVDFGFPLDQAVT